MKVNFKTEVVVNKYFYDKLQQSLKESTEQCSQLLRDKVKLESEIIALKEELNKQLKK